MLPHRGTGHSTVPPAATNDTMSSCRAARQVKPLFRLVHQRHHQNGSNVTALGTAFGDAADIGLCFVAFHGLLVLALWALPRWNIVHVVTLIAFEVQGLLQPCNEPVRNLKP